ncbi:MAG: HAD hydrolase family protein [Gemmatimonadaceae bacterium]|nr:HAD hydrolase family protein [Gemmatimonadaceae bacterium]
MPLSPLVIVSDVDGTLLDCHGQWFTAPVLLRQQLRTLSQRMLGELIVVLASSRTIDELIALQRSLGIRGPCIGEDGAVVAIDAPIDARALEYATRQRADRGIVHIEEITRGRRTLTLLRLGAPTSAIRQQLRAWPSMTADLAGASASRLESLGFRTRRHQQRALFARRGSVLLDPVQWRANQLVAGRVPLCDALDIVSGGRWLTATMGAGKGPASEFLRAYINGATSTPCHVVGIGDGANDESLLRAVDLPFGVPDATGRIHPVLREIPRLVALHVDRTAWPVMLTQLSSRRSLTPGDTNTFAAVAATSSRGGDTHAPEQSL